MILGIYGSNGTGRDLYGMIQMMESPEWEQIVFIDDTKEEGQVYGCLRIPFEAFQIRYKPENSKIVIAVGEPRAREALYNRVKEHGYALATIIHPSSIVFPTAVLREGCVVRMNCIISDHAQVSENVYIQSKVIIGHDAVIREHSVISSFGVVSGNCHLGRKVFMGIHSCIREKTSIGNNALIAMGAVVLKNISENATVAGNPARVMAINEQHSVFRER